ncbi:MAG: hypothetical protein ACJA1C_002155 [Crocinitomicaceae bacterium]|jgi:hypothetical protein
MAKTPPPIKTDLFRFVTFRSPEELTYQDKALRFVIHPNIDESIVRQCPVADGDPDSWNDFIGEFPQFENKNSLRTYNALLFDFANQVNKQKTSISEIVIPDGSELRVLTSEEEKHLFDALIGEVISKKSNAVRHNIAQMLIVNHILKNSVALTNLGLKKLEDIKIEIPSEVIDCFKPWLYDPCGGSLEGVQNLGIADFRRVEQEVCCYLPGEVSHIENIMAKEFKERSTRNYMRTENTIESERETKVENLTDVTTSTRNELSSEIADVLEEEQGSSFGGSVGVSAEYFGAQIDVNAYADFTTSNSSSYSNTQAQTYAEEVTTRALEKIVQRTSEKRTSKVIKEFEENNKHGFDNRGENSKHVTGVYRWIDIIYKNRLVNYGKRLMVEFMVPEPAEFYKNIMKYRKIDESGDSTGDLKTPMTLENFNITGPGDITALELANVASYYGVSIDPLPPALLNLTMSLAPLSPVDHNRNINNQTLASIVVPPDYEADIITGSYTYEYRANSGSSSQVAFCNYTFGGSIVNSGGDYTATKKNKTVSINLNLSPNGVGSLPVTVAYSGCFGFFGAVNIKCILKQSTISDWQNDAYNALLGAYNQKLEEYDQEVQANEEESEASFSEDTQSNPAMNRIIEQRELKRICIEMLMKPYCRTQGRDNNTDTNACDLYQIPQVSQTAEFTEYTRIVKFFEQAIDWQIMSYLFYPYYWADKCDWGDLIQSESDDIVFQGFLQSGMGRVVVPIREQFTMAFAYYIRTGDLWLGNELVAGADNDLYLSIAEEMQTVEGTVEDEWETRVPTSLAIIQGKSAFLEEEGLPCCEIIENDDTTSNISGTEDTLQIITP